ncbi:MAG TPA: hypothetical protein VH256_04405, partial [Thermoleophilaceae bacterium]|nr:hypothetical protein [Thermoleophilaceae bacterium]
GELRLRLAGREVAPGPDGKRLAVAAASAVEVIDVGGAVSARIATGFSRARILGWVDGGRALAVSDDDALEVWDATTGARLSRCARCGRAIPSPDGKRAAVRREKGLDIVDVATGRVVHTFPSRAGVGEDGQLAEARRNDAWWSADGTRLLWGTLMESRRHVLAIAKKRGNLVKDRRRAARWLSAPAAAC